MRARAQAVDDRPLPWLVGLLPCDSNPKRPYARGFEAGASQDNKEWRVEPLPNAAAGHHLVRSLSTGRCLSTNGTGSPVLLPCDASDAAQAWAFGKGIHSPSSLYSVPSGLALGADPSTLFRSAALRYKSL
jgi:hypothetical protein